MATADGSGASTGINTYDAYGVPGSGNTGRFQYTGQASLPELGLYHYKARLYAPTLGRFLQTDRSKRRNRRRTHQESYRKGDTFWSRARQGNDV